MNDEARKRIDAIIYGQSDGYLQRLKAKEMLLYHVPVQPEEKKKLQDEYIELIRTYGARTEQSKAVLKNIALECKCGIMTSGNLMHLDNTIEQTSPIVPCREENSDMASQHRETYTYRDFEGNRQTIRLGGDSKKETDEEFQRFIVEGKKKHHAPTLENFVNDTFRSTYIDGLEATTKDNYEQYLKLNIIPFLGNRHMDMVTVRDIQEFYNWMATAASRGRKKNLNADTIKRVGALTNRIFTVAMEMKLIEDTPFKRTLLRNPGEPSKHHEAVPPEIVDRVKKQIPTIKKDRHRMFIGLLAYTGMRREEVAGLKWENVNLAEGYAMVESVVTYADKSKGEIKPYPKTDSSRRTVLIPAPLKAIMQPFERIDGYVVHGRDPQKPLCYKTLGRTHEEVFAELGIKQYCNHDWRVTYGTELKESGMSTALAADLMGHADERMLNVVYARRRHAGVMKQQEAVEKLNENYVIGTAEE